MKMLAINCLAGPYWDANRSTSRITLSFRSDVLVRFCRGDTEYVTRFNDTVEHLSTEFGCTYFKLPEIELSNFSVFAWNTHADIAKTYMNVNGIPIATMDILGADRSNLFDVLPDRPVSAIINDLDAISRSLDALDIRKHLIQMDPLRAPDGLREAYCMANEYVESFLSKLGWEIHRVPPDAPSKNDGMWTHYDPEWARTFIEGIVDK